MTRNLDSRLEDVKAFAFAGGALLSHGPVLVAGCYKGVCNALDMEPALFPIKEWWYASIPVNAALSSFAIPEEKKLCHSNSHAVQSRMAQSSLLSNMWQAIQSGIQLQK